VLKAVGENRQAACHLNDKAAAGSPLAVRP
jgi:hypothetical protein